MNLSVQRRYPLYASLLVLILAIGGCASEPSPAAANCNQSNPELTLELANNTITPADPAACRDQRVRLTFTIKQAGTLIIQGYDNQRLEVSDGDTAVFDFTANKVGQFPIQLQTSDKTIQVGAFTVQEP